MKKLIIVMAVLCVATVANAAATSWKFTAGNMYAADGTSKYTGAFELYAAGGDLTSPTVVYSADSVVNGAMANKTFDSETLKAGETYDFYYVLSDGGKKLTSSTISVGALETGTATINWGNQATYTQNAGNWANVPEPTSGILMLLGVAGLALRRKRA